MLTQIYETASAEEAAALSEIGVDHIGILVGDGTFPREKSIDAACDIAAGIRGGAKSCVLCLSPDLSVIQRVIAALSPDILHLGCAPNLLGPVGVASVKRAHPRQRIMRSIPVVDETSVALARSYDELADFLLLDSYVPGDRQIGALGTTHNWELDRRIARRVRMPVIVAGGLGPENAADAIAVVHPAGVDSKTKTDKSDGSHAKDLDRVRAFVAAVRGFGGAANPE